MLKSLAKNSTLYYLSTLLSKGISFFLLPLYTSLLTQENYGVLELMSIISTMIIILFTFQIGQGVARFYNELRNQKHIQIYTSTVTFFALASFAIFSLLVMLFLPQIAQYLNLSISATILAVLSVGLNGLFYLAQNQLRCKIKPVQEMLSSLIYNLFTIGLTVYFLVILEEGLIGIFKAQCIGAFLGLLFAVTSTWKDYSTYFSMVVLKKLLRFSLPLIPSALAIFIYMFTDRICIKEMLGMEELGVYSVGNKIATILNFAGIGVLTALGPLIYKHYKEESTPEKIALLFRIFSSLSFILVAFLSFFAGYVIETMTNDSYSDAIAIIPYLLFAVYLNSLTIFFPGLAIAEKPGIISVISIIAGVINLILNVFLIPLYGIKAAAIATFISYGLNFLLLYTFAQKEYPIKVTLWPIVLVTVVFFLSLIIIEYYKLGNQYNYVGFFLCSFISIIGIMHKNDIIYIREKIAGIFNKKE